jgi:hypothetical protein
MIYRRLAHVDESVPFPQAFSGISQGEESINDEYFYESLIRERINCRMPRNSRFYTQVNDYCAHCSWRVPFRDCPHNFDTGLNAGENGGPISPKDLLDGPSVQFHFCNGASENEDILAGVHSWKISDSNAVPGVLFVRGQRARN